MNGTTFVLPPFGGVNEDLPKVLCALKQYFKGEPFEMHGIYEHTIERFQKYLPQVNKFTRTGTTGTMCTSGPAWPA